MNVGVLQSGAVLLGQKVVADGYYDQAVTRVQTHIHDDHMHSFETSKGSQNIILSKFTRDLLIAEYNADLQYRYNIVAVDYSRPYDTCGDLVTLMPNNHMAGSVQVVVQTQDGVRVGYSGDFSWPVPEIAQVDTLIVDSTYGNPDRARHYTQDDANLAFIELVQQQLRSGPVHIKAHRGTIQRALQLLGGQIREPLIASPRFCRTTAVYRENGYAIDEIMVVDSDDAKHAVRGGSYIRLYSKGDRLPVELQSGSMISLSAYMSGKSNPVLQFSSRSFRVALSDHADFEGTMAYVAASGASLVLTDNTRGQGVELAAAIRSNLGVTAVPSPNIDSP